MFIPFLAAAAVATAFAQLGAMSVRIAMLTGALNAMILVGPGRAAAAGTEAGGNLPAVCSTRQSR